MPTDVLSTGHAEVGDADALGHEEFATGLIRKAVYLPPGSVIAIQGPWGRGKTDVLARVHRIANNPTKRLPTAIVCESFWLNPWQYGTPDLLTPLVVTILERIPAEQRASRKALRKAAESIVRAGFNFGIKAATIAVPGAPLFAAAADAVDKLFGGLFEAADREGDAMIKPDADPVATMGKRFQELVQELVPENRMRAGARILVCVDDLDRCMPDRQVALLEAVRFLISSGAPATFFVALDPRLVRQAVVAHYRTDAFDPDQYLDKMFDLRVDLPGIGARLHDLVDVHLKRLVRTDRGELRMNDLLHAVWGVHAETSVREAAVRALSASSLTNPRVVKRIFDRLALLAASSESTGRVAIEGDVEIEMFLKWLTIVERWPDMRRAIQDGGAEGFLERVRHLVVLHRRSGRETKPFGDAQIDRLPQPDAVIELTQLLKSLVPEQLAVLQRVDQALVTAGL